MHFLVGLRMLRLEFDTLSVLALLDLRCRCRGWLRGSKGSRHAAALFVPLSLSLSPSPSLLFSLLLIRNRKFCGLYHRVLGYGVCFSIWVASDGTGAEHRY